MRYYDIRIFDETTGAQLRQFTSFVSGKTLPGALNVEIDAPVVSLDVIAGAAMLKIWGVSVEDIGSGFNFNNRLIQVRAGMQAGLPLANPKQSGLIFSGYIYQAFGNWQGTNMTLDFVVHPGTGTQTAPKNLTFFWPKGGLLSSAIQQTLSVAFPILAAPKINISADLVTSQDQAGYYDDVGQFAQKMREFSLAIKKTSGYLGVSIIKQDTQFVVDDGTVSSTNVLEISALDFIGQPTWLNAVELQIKCVMRADVFVSQIVKLPQILGFNQKRSTSFVRNDLTFTGQFQITAIRHVGNFRQADANSWVTVLNLVALTI